MGAFVCAAETGVPVIPVTLRGTRSVLRDKSLFPRRGSVSVTIDAAIEAPAGRDTWSAAVALRDAVRARILARCGEPDLGRERVRVAPE
jgi:1-acyl-sn-glycerol-3-phosphate acyltransferase